MKASESMVKRILITGIEGLDPVTAFLEDFERGKGALTITCFGEAWSHYWPAMGDRNMSEFIATSSSAEYIADKLLPSGCNKMEPDVEKFSDSINEYDVALIKKGFYPSVQAQNILEEEFGEDWFNCLPQVCSRDYKYLLKIVKALREVLKSSLSSRQRSSVAANLKEAGLIDQAVKCLDRNIERSPVVSRRDNNYISEVSFELKAIASRIRLGYQ